MVPSELTLPDGRRLAWVERGSEACSVVFAFHGLPGSRLQAPPDDRIACAAGARVIHVDRPGFGRSDRQPGRRLADWAGDIERLADHLCVERFAVVGVSGGGPFACACAAKLGQRITRAGIVSGVGPPGTMALAKSWVVRVAFRAAPRLSWLIAPPIAVAARAAVHAPGFFLDRLIEQVPQCDRDVLRRPEIRAVLLQDMVEAFRSGPAGLLQDLRLEACPWGLALEQVSCPVRLWHGDLDATVPVAATEALAALLPNASVCITPRAGHFLVFDIWGDILRWLVAGPHNGSAVGSGGRQ
jgi:pimeloyl-ACP methyl ester carboxylesterase